MTAAALRILESFDRLADSEKRRVAKEIQRRSSATSSRPTILGVGEFRSGRTDVSANVEDLMREEARNRR